MHMTVAVVAVEPLSIDIVRHQGRARDHPCWGGCGSPISGSGSHHRPCRHFILLLLSLSSLLPSTSIFAHLPMSVQFSYLFAIQSTHFTYELFICVAFAIMIICGFCVLESLAVALHAHNSDDFLIFVVSVDKSDVTASR